MEGARSHVGSWSTIICSSNGWVYSIYVDMFNCVYSCLHIFMDSFMCAFSLFLNKLPEQSIDRIYQASCLPKYIFPPLVTGKSWLPTRHTNRSTLKQMEPDLYLLTLNYEYILREVICSDSVTSHRLEAVATKSSGYSNFRISFRKMVANIDKYFDIVSFQECVPRGL